MSKVSINIIKEWFTNQKKPPQEQFWAWLDSFWHKDEVIPQSGIENLVADLQKKADLVGGVVPENQLPFSVKTSEVLQIGQITATENTVKVWVHSSGMNRIRLNGVIYERAFANPFTYTAVINYSKILIVYALPVVGLFFLAEGAEALEAIEPELPEGAFVIRRIVVNQSGQVIEAPIADGLKYNEEDGWRNIMLTEALTVLPYTFDLRSSYWINSQIVGATIGGIRNALIDRNASPTWDGKEFWIYNNTGSDLPLNSTAVTEEDVFLFTSQITLKDKQSCKVKIRRDVLEIVGVLSGEEFDPTYLQNQVDAEIVNRALADSAESTARQTADTNLENTKVDKPTTDGTWSLKKLGSVFTWVSGVVENISNADLSNISARIFTQGNEFTWNTSGLKYYLKNLVDKTNQAAYSKVVIVHPTTGETVTRDFADPSATTLAVQNANAAQKTAMRTALLGMATPANPVLQDCSVRFIVAGINVIDLYGINLTLLDPTFIWIERADSTRIYATNFYNISGTAVTTQWDIPSDLPNGDYPIKIQNGVSIQGLSTAIFTKVTSITQTTLLASGWKKVNRKLNDGVTNAVGGSLTAADNYVAIGSLGMGGTTQPATVVKSENIFLGSKDFDIEIDFQSYGATSLAYDYNPFIGLTEVVHSNFDSTNDLIVNNQILEADATRARINSGFPTLALNGNPSQHWWVYISKVGNKLFIRTYNKNTVTNFQYYQTTIDTTKNYALFVTSIFITNYPNPVRYATINARIMN